jgi:lipid II:glycine glycyltransferase (peptidoglycan interpeptide bridge formation enzyme)
MNVVELSSEDRAKWNEFTAQNFAPVGAFLQSWEWGDFKEKLYGKVTRYAVAKGASNVANKNLEWSACFQMETHTLPFGFKYGYAPRGPVLKKVLWEQEAKVKEIFDAVANYVRKELPELIFVRFEPAYRTRFRFYTELPFRQPRRYLQPRFNRVITVSRQHGETEEEILKSMSGDIRHDIRAAERLGVTVEDKETLTPEEEIAFTAMKKDTRDRSGKDIFPSEAYFNNFLASFSCTPSMNKSVPCVRYFVAKKQGVPVAINLNVFFAHTLTYLYGASYSSALSKRAPAYLHWKTMLYAHEQGMTYYDLGGVDETSWQGLSYFKKQFGGETMEYVGTVSFIQRPLLHTLYIKAKKFNRYRSQWNFPGRLFTRVPAKSPVAK